MVYPTTSSSPTFDISLDETDDHHLPTMEHIYACTRIIDDTSTRLCLRHTDTKPRQSNPPQPSATTTELKTKPTCGNCGGVHLTKNCFQAGGAMEGKRNEVLASRPPRSSQAHVAVADIGDTGTVPGADLGNTSVVISFHDTELVHTTRSNSSLLKF